jgi:hypothetical protein
MDQYSDAKDERQIVWARYCGACTVPAAGAQALLNNR